MESEPEVSFGAWIRLRRKSLDLTQSDLADRVGCSLSTIRKIESDERRPSRQIAALLAENLGVSQEALPTFLKVARARLRVERLGPATTTEAVPIPPPPAASPTFPR